MASFWRTAAWVAATAVGLYLVLTSLGLILVTQHRNALAQTILTEHRGIVASIYLRIGLGYLLASLAAAFLIHPFARGWRAAPVALALALLGLLHVLTTETHLLYGPAQSLFFSIRDAIPAIVRDLYRPWQVTALLGAFALLSLFRWSGRIPRRPRVALAGACALAAGAMLLLPLRPAAAAGEGPPCVLLLVSDSLRADHLSCNGYRNATRPDLPTTPGIDGLAAAGTNFANCLVPTASTHESLLALLTSTEPRTNGLRHMFPSREEVRRIERELVFLPRLLRERGYATAAIGGWCGTTFRLFDTGCEHADVSDIQNHRALVAEGAFVNHLLAASFLDNPVGRLLVPELDRVSFTRSPPAVTRRVMRWLDEAAGEDRPFFLVAVYHGTHLPYSAAHPYYALYADPEYRGRNRHRIDFEVDSMIQRGFDHDLTAEERQHIVNLYDGCVREFDDQVGVLLGHLEERGLRRRTIVGILADHGDDLYEHGTTLGHGVTLFGGDHTNRIPAVFAGPGVPARRVDDLVRSFDLAPTLLGWLGVEAPPAWEGVDLRGSIPPLTALLETSYLLYRQPVPDLEPGERVRGFPRLDEATRFDPTFDYNIVLRPDLHDLVLATKCFAVRADRWKLIAVPGEEGPIHRLFDLEADPQCTHNLARERPDVYARLRAQLPEPAR